MRLLFNLDIQQLGNSIPYMTSVCHFLRLSRISQPNPRSSVGITFSFSLFSPTADANETATIAIRVSPARRTYKVIIPRTALITKLPAELGELEILALCWFTAARAAMILSKTERDPYFLPGVSKFHGTDV